MIVEHSHVVSMKYGDRCEVGLPVEEIFTVYVHDAPPGGALWRVTIYGPRPSGWCIDPLRHGVGFSREERQHCEAIALELTLQLRAAMASGQQRMLGEIPSS